MDAEMVSGRLALVHLAVTSQGTACLKAREAKPGDDLRRMEGKCEGNSVFPLVRANTAET